MNFFGFLVFDLSGLICDVGSHQSNVRYGGSELEKAIGLLFRKNMRPCFGRRQIDFSQIFQQKEIPASPNHPPISPTEGGKYFLILEVNLYYCLIYFLMSSLFFVSYHFLLELFVAYVAIHWQLQQQRSECLFLLSKFQRRTC